MSVQQTYGWPGTFPELGASWGGYYYLGPVSIPPKVSYISMEDEETGTVYYLGWNGTAISPQTTSPGPGVNLIAYPAFDGPFLPLGLRAGIANGVLYAEEFGGGNVSPTPWIYRIGNPTQQTWPEPTNIPTPLPPTIPGIPSSAPAPTGGGYAAWIANQPRNLPTFLTTILTKGWTPTAAFWNGTAWSAPNGTLITGIITS